ncbi:dihydrodipicolinate synthase family protein [Paenibacillus sp. YN15]|uniref:dihydrodipicolinate synthase family protein n=1 Tax=Paenibacillus sp. YN15 TaxID=1742774 RepID=UPI0015EC73CC|nr:dihydrodipicolinate synthase family protein [Paenibacillus sp. YN15]
MARTQFEGIYPILATPFNTRGEVDEASLRELVRFQLSAGVDGIALFGMASEMYTLLEEERQRIAEIVSDEVKGRVPLIFGSGHTGAEAAVQLSKQAQKQGAAALMVLPPYMAKADGTRLYDYFAAIAKAVDIEIMIQDAPNASGVSIPASLLARLSKDFGNITMVKVEAPPTTVKITEVLEQTEGRLAVFGGMNAMYFYEELVRGAVGTMPACEFPEVCVQIYKAFQSGDRDSARRIFYRYLPFIRIGTLPGYAMAVHKEILQQGGVIASSHVRNPNAPLDSRTRDEVWETLKDLDLLALHWKPSR